MSQTLPERADVRQLRTQAKELLQSLHAAQSEAIRLANQHDPKLSPTGAKLTDAQRILAREYGFSSWPDLVEKVETPILLEKFKEAIDRDDPESLSKLLKLKPSLRKHLNDPIFTFDSPAMLRVIQGKNAIRMVRLLTQYGADPNARSGWWAGSFSALDHARPEVLDTLLEAGAKFDVWSAAAQGRADVLATILDEDPSLIDAPGGDGMTPLHFAGTLEIAKLLVDRGAKLDIKDIDHESTAAQYQILQPTILRLLVDRGADPDIYIATMLEDTALIQRLLANKPENIRAHVNEGEFATHQSDGGHIYVYKLGQHLTPLDVAAKFGKRAAFEELAKFGDPGDLLIGYAWFEDEAKFRHLLEAEPDLGRSLPPGQMRAIADAAAHGKEKVVRMLLEAGVDPLSQGMSGGSSLHVAAWFGYSEIVRILIPLVPLDTKDPSFGGTPLGWAIHGSQNCRNPKGEYLATIEALLEAGALAAIGDSAHDGTLVKSAGKETEIVALLKRFGAS
jgi:ankyrin repeat protein